MPWPKAAPDLKIEFWLARGDGNLKSLQNAPPEGHRASTVANDLALANELLSDYGVICLDDYLNPMYPQLTIEAVSDFRLRMSWERLCCNWA